MERLGIIDIGSNSVRLLLTEIHDSGNYKVFGELKESVRLGADMVEGLYLNEKRIIAAIDALKAFKKFCISVHVDTILAVATEAVRKSKNRDEFVKRVYAETSISIRVLSGEEEANYDCLGVTKSLYIQNAVIMDIGGASTELALVEHGKISEKTVLPMGAVNLTQKFQLEDLMSPAVENKLKAFLLKQFKDIPWISKAKVSSMVGIGGTIRNAGKIDRGLKHYPMDIQHNYRLKTADVKNIYDLVKYKNLKQRKKINGLSKDRADIFVAPICALYSLMDLLKVNNLIISGKGVREGVLYEYIIQKYSALEDILEYSIKNIIENHRLNIDHEQNVYKLASMLFHKLQSVHNLDDSYINILKTSAMLHDIGVNIRYYDNESHSFYMILNSELNGLTHKEILLSAFTASFNGNKFKGPNFLEFNALLNKSDLNCAAKLGMMIKLADSLDKSMCGIVHDIECEITEDTVTLTVICSSDASLEIRNAKRFSDSFNNIFQHKLIINTQ